MLEDFTSTVVVQVHLLYECIDSRVGRTEASRFAFSPIVTIEPRRRKFHRPITITLPVPKAFRQADLNIEPPENQKLRLLCSITGAPFVRLSCAVLSSRLLSSRVPISSDNRFRSSPTCSRVESTKYCSVVYSTVYRAAIYSDRESCSNSPKNEPPTPNC